MCENKDADQLCSNCIADQRLCFRDTDSIFPFLPKSEIPIFYASSVVAKVDLCQSWSEPKLLVFSHTGSYHNFISTVQLLLFTGAVFSLSFVEHGRYV